MKTVLTLAVGLVLSTTVAGAQSLKPNAPAPLQPGINKSTIDSFVGTHYWYFDAQPGHVHIHCQFKSMGLLGNASRASATFTLYDAANTWKTPKVLTADVKAADGDFDGDMKKPTRLMLSVAPPPSGLIRAGGDYEIEATGAVAFAQPSNQDPIVGMYKQMGGYTSLLGDCKFNTDGTVVTTSGSNGSWKLFDKDSHTYVIDIDGQERHSLQMMPGRGLCDNDMIIFQQLR